MLSDAVLAVLVAAAADPVMRRRLDGEPEEVGRAAGLTGAVLAELVGTVRSHAATAEKAARGRKVVEDIVLHDLGRGWPFGTLSVAELSERAALAREFATRLYVSRGLGHEGIGLRMVDLLAWARALDDEVRQRADDCDQVDVLLADAIIGAGALIGAVESLQSSS